MAYQYEVAILGSGPGGYVAAIKAAQQGLKVALVEKGNMGGTCLNVGCIPTKALLASAEMWRAIKGARDFGISVENAAFDYAKMLARKERVVKQLRGGVEFLMKKNNVTVLTGAGTLTGPHSIGIAGAAVDEITADALILASGSVPARPPIPGLDGANVLTSDEILFWPQIPTSLAVIGGGAIGLEFAFFFNALGTKVTVLEALPHILPPEDGQVAAELAASFKRQGITTQADALVTEIADEQGKKVVRYLIRGKEDLGPQELAVELVLAATGRWPFTAGCGYEAQGIPMDRRAVKVDAYCYTGIEHIYAIGDVIGGMLLAHKASAEAAVAVDNITGHRRAMDSRAIPTALYTSPEVASVGLHEAAAIEQGLDVSVGSFPFRALGKAVAIGEREGFAKMVVNKADGAIIGVQAIGPHVTDMIAQATLAVQHRLTADELANTIHPHPTLSEVFHEAIEVTLGHPIHI